MKWSPRVQAAALLVAGVGVGCWLLWPRGPSYGGRGARSWLATAESAYPSAPPWEVFRAFQAMGTNAVPPLLAEMLDPRNNSRVRPLGRWLAVHAPALLQRLPTPWKNWLATGPDSGEVAYSILCELRPPLALILPEVTQLLASPAAETRRKGMTLLGTVSDDREQAARLLAPFLVTNSWEDNIRSGTALRRLGPAASVAWPQILEMLKGSAWPVAVGCVKGLGPFATNALPSLRQHFDQENDESRRFYTALVAWDLDQRQFWGDGLVRTALRSSTNGEFVREIIEALGVRTNLASKFEPELVRVAQVGPIGSAWAALKALQTPGDEPNRVRPGLLDCLQSSHPEVQASAAARILELQPTNEPVLAWTADRLTDPLAPETLRIRLLDRLGHLGATPVSLLPAIRGLQDDSSADVRAWAAGAIRRIDSTKGNSSRR